MALLRGRGYASVNYPTGMNLGGDPTQALVHSTTTGNFVVSLSSVDLGQGLKTVAAQIVEVDGKAAGEGRPALVEQRHANGVVVRLRDVDDAQVVEHPPFDHRHAARSLDQRRLNFRRDRRAGGEQVWAALDLHGLAADDQTAAGFTNDVARILL